MWLAFLCIAASSLGSFAAPPTDPRAAMAVSCVELPVEAPPRHVNSPGAPRPGPSCAKGPQGGALLFASEPAAWCAAALGVWLLLRRCWRAPRVSAGAGCFNNTVSRGLGVPQTRSHIKPLPPFPPLTSLAQAAKSYALILLVLLLPRAAAQIVETLAGGGAGGTLSGSANGDASAALYFNPRGVAVHPASGNMCTS